MTKPYKKDTTKILHQRLEKLSQTKFIEKIDDHPNALINELNGLLKIELSGIDGNTELLCFSQGEFSKTKRAIKEYLVSITEQIPINKSYDTPTYRTL